jgi:hypothetical protein
VTASLENPFAGQGSVLLDIGGDVGAVVVTMPAAMLGTEVEIRPVGEDPRTHAHHPHVAVVNRPARGALVPSLVFPEVREGRYQLQQRDTRAARMTVDVRGGEVTTAAWPA